MISPKRKRSQSPKRKDKTTTSTSSTTLKLTADIRKRRNKLLEKMADIVGLKRLAGSEVPFEVLTNALVIIKFNKMVPELRSVYSSDHLTSLHENALLKQKFPGVNIFRQILREHGYNMIPVVRSDGYVGQKKIVKRSYLIKKVNTKKS